MMTERTKFQQSEYFQCIRDQPEVIERLQSDLYLRLIDCKLGSCHENYQSYEYIPDYAHYTPITIDKIATLNLIFVPPCHSFFWK